MQYNAAPALPRHSVTTTGRSRLGQVANQSRHSQTRRLSTTKNQYQQSCTMDDLGNDHPARRPLPASHPAARRHPAPPPAPPPAALALPAVPAQTRVLWSQTPVSITSVGVRAVPVGLKVSGPKGSLVTIHYGEKPNADETVIYQGAHPSLRVRTCSTTSTANKFPTDRYRLAGSGGSEVFEPKFSVGGPGGAPLAQAAGVTVVPV
ncbi:hypothetical protein GGX14DRAFT_606567 [Mycena pura]|uniref:Uncharacterized protein n=1 Tax=Mycena pura TaxID=153505 RepID=A0AAD6ULD7_9AGAR|nr:hypothetical protein GGX14DRAFT_606567 [Mycena pura]